jgi:hypothetical protein
VLHDLHRGRQCTAANSGGTFTGSIVNTAAVSAFNAAILILGVGSTVSGTAIGLFGVGASAFSGGITNSGKILSRTGAGIVVSAVADQGSFTGSHHNSSQFIDLINVTSAANVSATFSAGVLRVSSGTTVVAAIHLAGAYVTSNFHIGSGISGSVAITDPAAPNGGVVSGPAAAFPRQGVDLPNIAFGAHPTLAYSQNAADTGGTLTVTDGRHAASIALLGNYMAGSFVTAADGHGGMLVKQTPLSEQQPLLTHPRA